MRMRAENKLTRPKHDEGSTASNGRSLQKGPNLVRKLRVPTTNSLLQLCFHGFLIDKKSLIFEVSASPRIRSNNCFAISSNVTMSTPHERKNIWVALHHHWTKCHRHHEETMVFKTPTRWTTSMKPTSESSW